MKYHNSLATNNNISKFKYPNQIKPYTTTHFEFLLGKLKFRCNFSI